MPSATLYDCQTCGACCCNIDKNRALEYVDYIEVEPRDRLRRKPALMKKLVVHNSDGIPHMKLDKDQRCVALGGTVGERVSCTIYPDRPSGCKRVEPGDRECRRARKDRGIR